MPSVSELIESLDDMGYEYNVTSGSKHITVEIEDVKYLVIQDHMLKVDDILIIDLRLTKNIHLIQHVNRNLQIVFKHHY